MRASPPDRRRRVSTPSPAERAGAASRVPGSLHVAQSAGEPGLATAGGAVGGALAGAFQQADLQSVPLRSLPALQAALRHRLSSQHEALPVPQLTQSTIKMVHSHWSRSLEALL